MQDQRAGGPEGLRPPLHYPDRGPVVVGVQGQRKPGRARASHEDVRLPAHVTPASRHHAAAPASRPSTDKPVRQGIAARLLVPGFWATLSIVTMWLAVLFDGIFGNDMTFSNPPNVTTIPSAVLVALFAVIGTSAVAKRAFGGRD